MVKEVIVLRSFLKSFEGHGYLGRGWEVLVSKCLCLYVHVYVTGRVESSRVTYTSNKSAVRRKRRRVHHSIESCFSYDCFPSSMS